MVIVITQVVQRSYYYVSTSGLKAFCSLGNTKEEVSVIPVLCINSSVCEVFLLFLKILFLCQRERERSCVHR